MKAKRQHKNQNYSAVAMHCTYFPHAAVFCVFICFFIFFFWIRICAGDLNVPYAKALLPKKLGPTHVPRDPEEANALLGERTENQSLKWSTASAFGSPVGLWHFKEIEKCRKDFPNAFFFVSAQREKNMRTSFWFLNYFFFF